MGSRLPSIHRAARDGDLPLLKNRLERGDPVDSVWSSGFTPLHLACYGGHVDVVEALLEHGASVDAADHDTGMNALHTACVKHHTECVRLLLAHKPNVNATTESGWTPIMFASGYPGAQVELAALLIKHGARVNHQAISGTTALHEAVRCGELELCALLLEEGASLEIKDDNDLTPDDVALFVGDIDLARALRALRK